MKLKRLVADLSLDKAMLQELLQTNSKACQEARDGDVLMSRYTMGLRQACRCVRMTRSMYYYGSRMDPQAALRHRMREIAHARVRFGYRRIYMMLRRDARLLAGPRSLRLEQGAVPSAAAPTCFNNFLGNGHVYS
jgi:hypothetical protein